MTKDDKSRNFYSVAPNSLAVQRKNTGQQERPKFYALTHTFYDHLYGIAGRGGTQDALVRILALGTEQTVSPDVPPETFVIGYSAPVRPLKPPVYGSDLLVSTNYSILGQSQYASQLTNTADVESSPNTIFTENHNHSGVCSDWHAHDVTNAGISGNKSGHTYRILRYLLPRVIELNKADPLIVPLPLFSFHYDTETPGNMKFGQVSFEDNGFLEFPE